MAIIPDLAGISCRGAACAIVGSSLVDDRGGEGITDTRTAAQAFRSTGTSVRRLPITQP